MLTIPIRPELFWDVDTNRIDEKQNMLLIIERVLTLGNLSEFKLIESFYGKTIITDCICKIGYLDPKTLDFVIGYYHISKEKIKCYEKKRSQKLHWD